MATARARSFGRNVTRWPLLRVADLAQQWIQKIDGNRLWFLDLLIYWILKVTKCKTSKQSPKKCRNPRKLRTQCAKNWGVSLMLAKFWFAWWASVRVSCYCNKIVFRAALPNANLAKNLDLPISYSSCWSLLAEIWCSDFSYSDCVGMWCVNWNVPYHIH